MAMVDSELVAECVTLTSDAREVLEKLKDFITDTGNITWNLSGGSSITISALQTLLEDLKKDTFGSETVTTTYSGSLISQLVRTFENSYTLTKDYTYTDGLPTGVTTTFKNSTGTTIWTVSRTISYHSDGRLDSIS